MVIVLVLMLGRVQQISISSDETGPVGVEIPF